MSACWYQPATELPVLVVMNRHYFTQCISCFSQQLAPNSAKSKNASGKALLALDLLESVNHPAAALILFAMTQWSNDWIVLCLINTLASVQKHFSSTAIVMEELLFSTSFFVASTMVAAGGDLDENFLQLLAFGVCRTHVQKPNIQFNALWQVCICM